MKQLFCIAALAAVVIARPEHYKENEEFQYTRSSSDDGTKSGYYGARRGNMGGNYEKAHNMDYLAQNQMSGIVSQVHGELGDAAKLRAGDVFAGANSRGVYGASSSDLSNLQGRNFQEGERVGYDGYDSTHSALSSQNSGFAGSHHSSGYSGHSASSQYNGYQGTKSAQALHSANLQATEGVGAYNYGRESGYNSAHSSQYGYQHQGVVPSNRLIATAPVHVVVRPGGTVAVPVGVQNYDTAHAYTHSASIMDQNHINTEAEVLAVPDHVIYKPNSHSKYYESSSNYQKKWERHDGTPDVIPLAIPTDNPFPKNSELYDDAQALHTSGLDYSGHANSYNHAYNTKSASSRYQSANNQFASGLNSNTHGAYVGGIADSTNSLGSAPKSHSSSYSYHKSWERQGDPYVITPVVGVDTASQKLTQGNQGYESSHQYGAHSKSSHQRYYQANGEECDCDENGNVRVARSVDSQDFGQQTQDQWGDLTQQAQTGWDKQRQHTSEKLEDLGQQTKKQWGDLTQEAQTGWDREGKRTSENFKELGQQTQKQWDDLRKQTQNSWDSEGQRNGEMYRQLGQQTQKQWEDLSQQTQHNWDRTSQRNKENFEVLGQQTQKQWGDLTQRAPKKLEDFGQQSEDKWEDLTQQAQTSWDGGRHKADQKLEDFGQQAQINFGQRTQVTWDAENKNTFVNSIDTIQKPQHPWNSEDVRPKVVNTRDAVISQNKTTNDDEQQTQNTFGFYTDTALHNTTLYSVGLNKNDKRNNDNFASHTNTQSTHHSDKDEGFNRQYQNGNWRLFQDYHDNDGQQTQSWDDFFHHSNINMGNGSDLQHKRKPIWEQIEDDSAQISEHDSFFDRDTTWKPVNQRSLDKRFQEPQSPFSSWKIDDVDGKTQGQDSSQQSQNSLTGLWDKINNFEQVYSMDHKTKNNSNSWQGQVTSQSSYESTWNENRSYNFSQQNINQTNQQVPRRPTYNSWIPMIGDSGMINYHSTSTTVNPTDEKQMTSPRPVVDTDIGRGDIGVTSLRPVVDTDIGRGDIGSEDTYKITTSDKPFASSSNQGLHTFTEDKNREKTAEEIEALSLKKDLSDQGNNMKSFETPSVEHQDSSELKVIGIEEKANSHRKPSENINLSDKKLLYGKPEDEIDSDHTRPVKVTNNDHHANVERNSRHSQDQSQFAWGQHSVDFLQQEQMAGFSDYSEYQENGNLDRSYMGLEQYQTQDYYNQQHILDNTPRQTLKSDNLNQFETINNISRSQIDDTVRLTINNISRSQIDDTVRLTLKSDNLNKSETPETINNITRSHSFSSSHIHSAHIEPENFKEEKEKGFWKCLGTKITNAKDKVSSWFKRS